MEKNSRTANPNATGLQPAGWSLKIQSDEKSSSNNKTASEKWQEKSTKVAKLVSVYEGHHTSWDYEIFCRYIYLYQSDFYYTHSLSENTPMMFFNIWRGFDRKWRNEFCTWDSIHEKKNNMFSCGLKMLWSQNSYVCKVRAHTIQIYQFSS